jgi:hypothetical protein
MSDGGQGIAKAVITELLEPLKGVLEKLTGPWATEIGESLGDRARAYRAKNQVKLLRKVKAFADAEGIQLGPVAPRLFHTIFEGAAFEDDEDLHTRWAALLTNASAPETSESVLPSFPDILKQLTPAEAQFLDRAYDEMPGPGDKPVPGHTDFGAIKDDTLATITDVMIVDLERLGLLHRHGQTRYESRPNSNLFGAVNHIYVSPYGQAFICACQVQKRAPK